jgi:hypothetical protein
VVSPPAQSLRVHQKIGVERVVVLDPWYAKELVQMTQHHAQHLAGCVVSTRAFASAAGTDCSFARSVSAPNEIRRAQLVDRIESAESCYFSSGTPAMAAVVVVTMSLSTAAAVGDGKTFHRHCRPASDANGAVELRHRAATGDPEGRRRQCIKPLCASLGIMRRLPTL